MVLRTMTSFQKVCAAVARRAAHTPSLLKRPRVFCIGFNKTGTSSFGQFFEMCGYRLMPTRRGELLLDAYRARRYSEILNCCRYFNAFQDIPFSLPLLYPHLEQRFRTAKFILSHRDDAEQWFASLLRWHQMIVDVDAPPTPEQLDGCGYIRKGWLKDAVSALLGTPEGDPYNPEIAKTAYERHIKELKRYFEPIPEKLLIVNPADDRVNETVWHFFELDGDPPAFPHLNKTVLETIAEVRR